jgi:predicted ArsR family transcriptional regulator
MNGMILSEMSEELNIPVNTLRQRITRLGIKPMTKEAVYSRADFEKIKDVEMGRPKKAAEPEPAKPKAKKPAKPKK